MGWVLISVDLWAANISSVLGNRNLAVVSPCARLTLNILRAHRAAILVFRDR
jgi:hypothetical protein